MTLRNRVPPTGEIAALPYRGLFMGNRGILHDDERRVVRPWNLTAWLICTTEWPGVRRTLMSPRNYTELFFLDELHALAAGHRPCFSCRRTAFHAFLAATGHDGANALDEALHAERLTGSKGMRRANRPPRRHLARGADLPVGAMVVLGETAFALATDGWIAWSRADSGRYAATLDEAMARDAAAFGAMVRADEPLTVLTPPTTLSALRGGYEPAWHPSADAAARL